MVWYSKVQYRRVIGLDSHYMLSSTEYMQCHPTTLFATPCCATLAVCCAAPSLLGLGAPVGRCPHPRSPMQVAAKATSAPYLRYVAAWRVMLRDPTAGVVYSVLCSAVPHHVESCLLLSRLVTSGLVPSRLVSSRLATRRAAPRRVVSCRVMSCHERSVG